MESEDVRLLNYVLRWRTLQLEEKIEDAHRIIGEAYSELREFQITVFNMNKATLTRLRCEVDEVD